MKKLFFRKLFSTCYLQTPKLMQSAILKSITWHLFLLALQSLGFFVRNLNYLSCFYNRSCWRIGDFYYRCTIYFCRCHLHTPNVCAVNARQFCKWQNLQLLKFYLLIFSRWFWQPKFIVLETSPLPGSICFPACYYLEC